MSLNLACNVDGRTGHRGSEVLNEGRKLICIYVLSRVKTYFLALVALSASRSSLIFSVSLLIFTINPHSLRHKSHRSPWSNEYDPPLEDGTVPSPRIRKMEITANEAFDTYREMYVLEWNERAVFLIYSSIALQVL